MKFSPFENSTIEAIGQCNGAIKQCGKNAILHLEKAWKIRDIDTEMALFRAITAEEEAASAVFYCLKNNRYKNSDKIKFKEHAYKLGLHPFLVGVKNSISEFILDNNFPVEKYYLKHIKKNDRKAISLTLSMPKAGFDVTPEPPLHFSITSKKSCEICNFESDFKKYIDGSGYDNSVKYIRNIANTRNKILYANSQGIAKIEVDIDAYINSKKLIIMGYLAIILMIDPWEKESGPSLFVQQALDSYLLLLGRISDDDVIKPSSNNR